MVRSKTGCTVTQETSPGKYITVSVPADEDTPVFAHTGKFDVDDEGAIVTEVFNSAPYQKLRLLGVVGGNDVLPAGYTRLAYLESTGTQFIDTGIELDDTVDASVKVNVLDGSALIPEEASLSGNFSDTEKALTLCWSDGTSHRVNLRFGNNFVRPVDDASITYAEKGIPHVFRNNSTGYHVDGELRWVWPNSNTWSTSNTFLFMVSSTNFASNYNAKNARWYNLTIIKNGELAVGFTPCLAPTGAPCMFDTVTRQPFYNFGTGAFIAGIEKQEQLNNMLRRLPDRTGQDVGTLQVRLAADLQTAANEARLDAMLAKNWEISQAA